MKARILLLVVSLVFACATIVYGAFYKQYKIYEPPGKPEMKATFYDWLKEPEVIALTTYGGITKTGGQLISHYKLSLTGKRAKKFCPS